MTFIAVKHCGYLAKHWRLQIYFDILNEFLARTPSKVPGMFVEVRHNSPAGSDVCLLCPGGEPEANKYVAEITFIVPAGVPETEEYMTMVSQLQQLRLL